MTQQDSFSGSSATNNSVCHSKGQTVKKNHIISHIQQQHGDQVGETTSENQDGQSGRRFYTYRRSFSHIQQGNGLQTEEFRGRKTSLSKWWWQKNVLSSKVKTGQSELSSSLGNSTMIPIGGGVTCDTPQHCPELKFVQGQWGGQWLVGSPPNGADEKIKLIVINGTETSPYLVTFIKSTVNIFVVTWVACDCVFCWCIRGPWELLATGLSDIYICRLQKWGQEVLEVLEVPVVCSPEPTANCLHATNPAAVIALLHPGSFLLLLNCFYIQIPQWRQC